MIIALKDIHPIPFSLVYVTFVKEDGASPDTRNTYEYFMGHSDNKKFSAPITLPLMMAAIYRQTHKVNSLKPTGT
jgi:hypothetical protein